MLPNILCWQRLVLTFYAIDRARRRDRTKARCVRVSSRYMYVMYIFSMHCGQSSCHRYFQKYVMRIVGTAVIEGLLHRSLGCWILPPMAVAPAHFGFCHPRLLRLLVSTASTTIPWHHINSIDFVVHNPSRCNNHGWQNRKSKRTVYQHLTQLHALRSTENTRVRLIGRVAC